MIVKYIIIIIVSYLSGSINPAIILSKKIIGTDIRSLGSGNAGSTNIQRIMGDKYATKVAFFDFLKTFAAITFSQLLFYGFDLEAGMTIRMISGTAVIIGHIWPVFFNFRGGKGVMTAATMALCFHPLLFLVIAVVFFVTVLITKYISLSSMLATTSFAVLLCIFYPNQPLLICLAVFIVALIIFMHRSNIKRLLKGTENKFSFKKKA